ncbi:MAG: hypothetical protein ABIU09_10445 [Pyrinomonadaceae bacterium]
MREAASKIEQSANKIHHSLFWFLKTEHIYETAPNHLKESNPTKADAVWELVMKAKLITAKNHSAAQNLSTRRWVSQWVTAHVIRALSSTNAAFNPSF